MLRSQDWSVRAACWECQKGDPTVRELGPRSLLPREEESSWHQKEDPTVRELGPRSLRHREEESSGQQGAGASNPTGAVEWLRLWGKDG